VVVEEIELDVVEDVHLTPLFAMRTIVRRSAMLSAGPPNVKGN
jgi:hypothetical protein